MIGTIIQARLGSERLPRKVLMKMPKGSRVTVLERVYNGVSESKLNQITVITTPDKKLADWCEKRKICCNLYTGERNVLKEFFDTAHKFCIDPIIRITADCPLIFGKEIDRVIKFYLTNDFEYAYNHHDENGKKGDGLDVEIFSYEALTKAFENANPDETEHVTTYIRKNCKMGRLNSLDCNSRSLNTKTDYLFLSNNWGKLKCLCTRMAWE